MGVDMLGLGVVSSWVIVFGGLARFHPIARAACELFAARQNMLDGNAVYTVYAMIEW